MRLAALPYICPLYLALFGLGVWARIKSERVFWEVFLAVLSIALVPLSYVAIFGADIAGMVFLAFFPHVLLTGLIGLSYVVGERVFGEIAIIPILGIALLWNLLIFFLTYLLWFWG